MARYVLLQPANKTLQTTSVTAAMEASGTWDVINPRVARPTGSPIAEQRNNVANIELHEDVALDVYAPNNGVEANQPSMNGAAVVITSGSASLSPWNLRPIATKTTNISRSPVASTGRLTISP
mmetsp:Transcript_8105/g.14436  ORF Transcript_8105/g.14436 Transcript_8105/m.14436 type:complete len:123 (+) Transcript_8105:194-562(+)